MALVKSATVVQWNRQGFRLYWRWQSRRLGRPRMVTEIRVPDKLAAFILSCTHNAFRPSGSWRTRPPVSSADANGN